jgi:hypothetical protein
MNPANFVYAVVVASAMLVQLTDASDSAASGFC